MVSARSARLRRSLPQLGSPDPMCLSGCRIGDAGSHCGSRCARYCVGHTRHRTVRRPQRPSACDERREQFAQHVGMGGGGSPGWHSTTLIPSRPRKDLRLDRIHFRPASRPLILRRPVGRQRPHRIRAHAHHPGDRLDRRPLRPVQPGGSQPNPPLTSHPQRQRRGSKFSRRSGSVFTRRRHGDSHAIVRLCRPSGSSASAH